MTTPSRYVGAPLSVGRVCAAACAVLTATAPQAARAQAAGAPAAPAAWATASVASPDPAPLRPGDALRVRTWRVPELSGEFMVDERGVVTLPRLGEVPVVGRPLAPLRAWLVGQYTAFLSADASVEVTPLYRVRVVGAVRNPGLFTVDPTMTVVDALGLAGGVTPDGRTGRVTLLRDGRRVGPPLSSAARVAQLGLRSGDELYIPSRSWLSRNPGVLFGAVSAVATLAWAIRPR